MDASSNIDIKHNYKWMFRLYEKSELTVENDSRTWLILLYDNFIITVSVWLNTQSYSNLCIMIFLKYLAWYRHSTILKSFSFCK